MMTPAEFARAQGGETVQAGKAFVPEVLFKGKYYPICGHYFWDTNHGATTFCKLLGFPKGESTKTEIKYNVDAMPVGKCKSGEELTKCTDGGNAWGDFAQPAGTCKKGNGAGVTVTCSRMYIYICMYLCIYAHGELLAPVNAGRVCFVFGIVACGCNRDAPQI